MWTSEEGRRLFILLNSYKEAGNTRIQWKNIVAAYNKGDKIKKRNVQQAMNYVATCKEKYTAWKAMQNMSGISFDENHLPVAEELGLERMQKFIATTAQGSFVAKNVLNDLPLWEEYFGGNLATGSLSISPALAKRKAVDVGTSAAVNSEGESGDNDVPSSLNVASQPSRSTSKRSKASTSNRSEEILKLYEIVKITDPRNHSDALLSAVTSMDEVKKRGNQFASRAIKYLIDNKLDHMFVHFTCDVMKWEWLKDLD